ncbi:MAG: helix-turn-helix domain-containing protein [Ruminococcaceae bacterium]|nr:helix-turn-helix domain-containing protein [Oscillospiraceae bacterium]
MDQIKIGNFIAERRRAKNLTQAQLAEMLGITDRAVSKWENGRSLPDSGIMLELCSILGITVNELLCGEVIGMENKNEKLEDTLLEMVKEKEKNDKWLLRLEIALGIVIVGMFLGLCVVAAYVPMEDWIRLVIVLSGCVMLCAAVPFLLRIEQRAGYYECQKCGHKYVPSFKAVNLAPHMGRTRYMKCPECHQRSWQKKRISKD